MSSPAGAPTAALSTSPRNRDAIYKGLPWPALPAATHLRKVGRARKLLGSWPAYLIAAAAGGAAVFAPEALPLVLGLCLFGGVVLLPRWLVSRTRRFNHALGEGIQLLFDEKPRDALPLIEGLARTTMVDGFHVVCLYQLARARMALGDWAGALELDAVVARNKLHTQPAIADSLPFTIALEYAMLEDFHAAELWLEHGTKRRNLQWMSTAETATALIRARAGRVTEAAALLEASWTRFEASQTARVMKLLRVVLAMCLHSDGREPARVHALVAGAVPLSLEVEVFARDWPALRAFLVEQLPEEVRDWR